MIAGALMICSLAACSNNNDATTDETDENKPISIMVHLQTPEVPDKKIQNLIEEKTGTKLDIQWVPASNFDERLNAAFATGSLSQVLYVSDLDTFQQAIRDDQFWEIGPYLDDFENLSNLKPEILNNTMVDNKIYTLYQGRPLSRSGIIYRKDWADNLGLDAPTNIDEVFEMLRAFTEDDPDGNGRDDTFGLTDRNELLFGAFKTVSSWFGTPNTWGLQDGVVTPEFMFDEYMDTLVFFNELYESGYINKDFPVTSKNDQQDLLKTGKAGLYIGTMADVETMYNDATNLNPDVEFDVHNRIEGPTGEYNIFSIPGYSRMLLFPKSSVETEEELLKILDFYDQMMEKENADLLFWGVEDEHYTVNDEGLAEAIPENKQANDIEVRPYLSMEIGEPETTGRYRGLSSYEPKMKAEELQIDNEDFLVEDVSLGLTSDTDIRDGERLQEMINDATYNFILGQIDEEGFKNAVDNWKSQGGQKIIDEYTQSYKDLN